MFLFRFGGDLLSHVLRRSTIGATTLNFRVRDGIGCLARAVTTKPEKEHGAMTRAPWASGHGSHQSWAVCPDDLSFHCGVLRSVCPGAVVFPAVSGSDQANRAISTGQLSTLLRLHLRPIDVVVFHGPDGETLF